MLGAPKASLDCDAVKNDKAAPTSTSGGPTEDFDSQSHPQMLNDFLHLISTRVRSKTSPVAGYEDASSSSSSPTDGSTRKSALLVKQTLVYAPFDTGVTTDVQLNSRKLPTVQVTI